MGMDKSIKYEDTIFLKDKIKSLVSIRDVMLSYGVDLIDHASGLKGMACCPFHNERNPSFSVDYERGLYNCFSCHAKGDLFTFVGEKQGLSNWREIVEYICNEYGITVPKDGKLSIEEEVEKLKSLNRHQNISNLAKHRELFDRIILEVYQKIKFCLDLKNADKEYIEKKAFPLFMEIDEAIESDKFDYAKMEVLSNKLSKIIDKLRRR